MWDQEKFPLCAQILQKEIHITVNFISESLCTRYAKSLLLLAQLHSGNFNFLSLIMFTILFWQKLHCIESECILTVGVCGLGNSARSPLWLFTPSPTRVAACACALLKYLQLCQALGCVAPARSLVHCTSQGHCCALFCGNYTLQHIIIMCYKRKHWSATETSCLKIILWAEVLSFLLLYLHLNIALYQVFLQILRSFPYYNKTFYLTFFMAKKNILGGFTGMYT